MKYWTSVVLHVSAYVLVAPFVGGFSASLLKYLAEKDMKILEAIGPSLLAGIASIVFYGVAGLAVGAVTSIGVRQGWLSSLVLNLAGSCILMLFATGRSSFFDGYRWILFSIAVLFACLMTLGFGGNPERVRPAST